MIIIRNSARCLGECGEEIVSEYRHDYKWCSCNTVMVDGGTDYLRRGWNGDYEDTSITDDGEPA